MLDFVAYLHAQEHTAHHAREALPDAPVQPVTPASPLERRQGLAWLRDRIAWRPDRRPRLGGRSEPASSC